MVLRSGCVAHSVLAGVLDMTPKAQTTWVSYFACIALLVLFPSIANACSVCFDAREGTRWAFIITTGLLSFAPLFMIGGVVYWLRKRVDDEEKRRLAHPSK
jgi:hypothetical protein